MRKGAHRRTLGESEWSYAAPLVAAREQATENFEQIVRVPVEESNYLRLDCLTFGTIAVHHVDDGFDHGLVFDDVVVEPDQIGSDIPARNSG
jgi:hypothetical protein